ncbi:MAG: ferric reductase-like transmembrane domain-containing protein [Ilumatobacteraceae bacterium]
MNEQGWWYLSRATGMVAWVLLGASCLWGILLVTRMLKQSGARPAWLLDLHRWLGALAVITTLIHILALVADNFVHFGWKEVLVPNGSEWKTGAVTWGVFAMYLLVVIEASSLMMKKLPKRLWRGIHLTAYLSFAMATVHGVAAGTDRSNIVYIVAASGGIAIMLFAVIARMLQARHQRLSAPAAARG